MSRKTRAMVITMITMSHKHVEEEKAKPALSLPTGPPRQGHPRDWHTHSVHTNTK